MVQKIHENPPVQEEDNSDASLAHQDVPAAENSVRHETLGILCSHAFLSSSLLLRFHDPYLALRTPRAQLARANCPILLSPRPLSVNELFIGNIC